MPDKFNIELEASHAAMPPLPKEKLAPSYETVYEPFEVAFGDRVSPLSIRPEQSTSAGDPTGLLVSSSFLSMHIED